MTEGIARDYASHDTTCGARRRVATNWARWRAGLSLAVRTDGPGLIATGLVAALIVLALWPSPTEVAGRRPVVARLPTPTGESLQRLPLAAQAAISTALGADRAGSAARPMRGGYALSGGGVSAQLGHRGVSLRGAAGSVTFTLTAAGRPGAMHAIAPGAPVAHANRVTYRHGDIAEWYSAGPLGLEQGYTVARRPAGHPGTLVLQTAVGGSLRAHRVRSTLEFTTRSGAVSLRYGGLEAVDASGRQLPAALALRGDRLFIRVADRDAHYPVRIDPFVQQGHKLSANDSAFPDQPLLGVSLAVSQDGSTMLVGGSLDGPAGAAWVFTNSGGVWSQQGGKLAPNNASGHALFGNSVALSRDGNVALIGAPLDTNGGATNNPAVPEAGAAWIFGRSGNTWSQESKVMPRDAVPVSTGEGALFGTSVALSGDGDIAMVGAPRDSNDAGAAWVFSTNDTQLQKLTPPRDATAIAAFGHAVALSDDGRTALIAGTVQGAVWAFTRASNTAPFTQQSPMLTPRDGNGVGFGSALALSTDGNTALIGSPRDTNQNGAAWVFTRTGTNWAQQGPKLTPSDETNAPSGGQFGSSVALAADGNTALIGAPFDFGSDGGAWMFVRSGTSWSQRGAKIAVNTVAGGEQGQGQFGTAVGLSGDGIRALIAAPQDSGNIGGVWAFNQVPDCVNRAATAPPGGGTVSITLSCVGPVGQPISYAIATGPGHGGVGSINPITGALSYVSQPGFSGTDTFTYVASDTGGTSQPATVTITVPPAPPTCAATSAVSKAGGGAVSVKLSCAGPAGVGIQYGIVSGPAHGTLGALDQAGSLVYTPSPGFHGSDSFTYDASDAGGASAPARATITVPPGPPICASIASSTPGEGIAFRVQLSCSGPAGVALTYAIASKPAHGSLGAINQSDHSVRYTPRIGYHGQDRFTYTATDPGGRSLRATATITIPKPQGTLAFAFLAWSFNPLASYTQVTLMTVSGLPVGSHVAAVCRGHGCHFSMAPIGVTSTTACASKKHRCNRKSRPHTHSLDLTSKVRATRFPAGSTLTVRLTKRGFVGKVYVFSIRAHRQPGKRVTCLAPGSLIPGKACS